jgi:Saccharopine dehydrogenase NADP binding domain
MKIAVFGASGHTARFIIGELLRRGHIPIAITRENARLEDADSLDRALAGAEAVINCAGPFVDSATPLIEAALRTRVHYFDVTAEQESARLTFERFDAPARERGVLIVPATGFYGGFGDVVATLAMGDWAHADRIDIGIALSSWWPTRGTRRTGERNTVPRLTFTDGKLSPMPPSAPSSWSFPQPFGTQDVIELPFTETILAARHLHARDIHNYLNTVPLRDIRDPKTPEPVAADERGRSNQRFVIDVRVHKGEEERRVTAQGGDIYAITAPIVAEAIERACAGPHVRSGAFALGELVDASAFLQALVDAEEIVLTSDGKTAVAH